ncbi:MAG: branched-chain amino acid ABC transporter permease [Desulfobacteraceae bacterium]|nr:MAG: branched-chain amino acid ABC transporter permease [Desulfobacteraceae bacterium]
MSSYAISLLSVIGINVILAVSLNMITGFCGQFSLGHAAFFGTGAYAAALLARAGSPFVLALVGGALAAGLLGFLVGFASLRVRDDFLAITTIGVGFLFIGFVRKQEWLGGEMGITGIPPTGLSIEGNAVLVLVIAALTIVLSLYLKRSWLGFSFLAVADDQDAAPTVGIDVSAYKLAAFALGTGLAGLAGGLYTYFTLFITAEAFNFIVSVTIMSMVVIGGVGSTWGVAAAAVLLTLFPEFFRFINNFRLIFFGGLLLIVMRFSPGGLAGMVNWALKRRLAQ